VALVRLIVVASITVPIVFLLPARGQR